MTPSSRSIPHLYTTTRYTRARAYALILLVNHTQLYARAYAPLP